MIEYEHFVLDNGLEVYVHHTTTTSTTAFNLLYNIGARDETESKTGFAHLFEHLMFGGSRNVASYDVELQKVGAQNNAFTSNDITNYYIVLPSNNIETAFWLESDRMLSLSFDPKVLEVQRKVVIEEFKQRYLNQPYGDVWLKLRPLAYKVHPYQWATIGKEISHIEEATMDDVKAFFAKFYTPNNAILTLAGNTSLKEAKELAKKWFGGIPAGEKYIRNLPKEPSQQEARLLEVEADVPLNAIYKAYHMPGRIDKDYHTIDLLSDVLGRGKSSRLYKKLVHDEKMFNSITAYLTGSIDPGLLIIQGNLNQGISLENANQAIEQTIEELFVKKVNEQELEKVKNQAESTWTFSQMEPLNKAMNLAYYANLGNVNLLNDEPSHIHAVSLDNLENTTRKILTKNNCSTLYYKAKNS